ncbi:hypothetical protein EDD27_4001 [Nonomuraea polychroma]|uniref:Uncharacterized protein n=1 Tax=Nonomuraea polychroma TaxID=46176 RepID=A0A438M6W5_9ACTN|nr:hypothetical protein [Nonomuraea polychroma]RVX41461.1 hypothetical protein EDD27_4001 [Nonomuraea polychroma]
MTEQISRHGVLAAMRRTIDVPGREVVPRIQELLTKEPTHA